MKKLVLVLALLLAATGADAVEVSGVRLEPTVSVNGENLTLNGYGIRKKFIIKVYIGSLYASRRVSSAEEALSAPGGKLIRMNFLHGKVEKEKIVEAFSEGFANNAPDVARSAEARTFLSLFTNDFLRGDTVDLVLGAGGAVSARHNGKVLGSVQSGALAKGILLIYLGPKPADEGLRKGMLGLQ